MRLLDKIKHAFSAEHGSVPPTATFAVRPDMVYAPVTGMLVSLKEVNDEIISGGLFGEGYGILSPSSSSVLYAPITGRISITTVTNHAIGLTSADGIEVLIHVGIGTVNMNGRGFNRLVEVNQEVRAGEPILTFDTEAIHAAGYDDVVTCVVTNSERLAPLSYVGDSSTLLSGRPLVKVGDPLLKLTIPAREE